MEKLVRVHGLLLAVFLLLISLLLAKLLVESLSLMLLFVAVATVAVTVPLSTLCHKRRLHHYRCFHACITFGVSGVGLFAGDGLRLTTANHAVNVRRLRIHGLAFNREGFRGPGRCFFGYNRLLEAADALKHGCFSS